jgi:hypothetical protein
MVEWNEWGPEATRWFTDDLSVAVCGSRVLFTYVQIIKNNNIALLFDFNQRRVRRSKGQKSRREDKGENGNKGVINDDSEGTGTTKSMSNSFKDAQVDGDGEVQSQNLPQSNPTSADSTDWMATKAVEVGEHVVTDAQVWEFPVDPGRGQLMTTKIRCKLPFRCVTTQLETGFRYHSTFLGLHEIIGRSVSVIPSFYIMLQPTPLCPYIPMSFSTPFAISIMF